MRTEGNKNLTQTARVPILPFSPETGTLNRVSFSNDTFVEIFDYGQPAAFKFLDAYLANVDSALVREAYTSILKKLRAEYAAQMVWLETSLNAGSIQEPLHEVTMRNCVNASYVVNWIIETLDPVVPQNRLADESRSGTSHPMRCLQCRNSHSQK